LAAAACCPRKCVEDCVGKNPAKGKQAQADHKIPYPSKEPVGKPTPRYRLFILFDPRFGSPRHPATQLPIRQQRKVVSPRGFLAPPL
jgi:hypothetical protein